MSENPAAMDRREKRAAVRRLLMYWGNAERMRTDKEKMLVAIEDEIESQYDLHPQRLTGMPHGSGISDTTSATATRAAREIKRLERKKRRIESELDELNYHAGMIEFEVMCLPPLEYEVVKLRYVSYGVAKKGYWEKIARQMHVSQDWAKALERQGVDRLIDRIDV